MIWNNISQVLERYAPLLVDEYKSLSKIQRVTYTVGNYFIEITLPYYWKYVEEGRGPGKFPPPDKIKNWIQVNHILPRPINGITPNENQLTFLISRKIAREGTKGKHALQQSVTSILGTTFFKDLEDAANKDLREWLMQ